MAINKSEYMKNLVEIIKENFVNEESGRIDVVEIPYRDCENILSVFDAIYNKFGMHTKSVIDHIKNIIELDEGYIKYIKNKKK